MRLSLGDRLCEPLVRVELHDGGHYSVVAGIVVIAGVVLAAGHGG
jgi:hypothetical protein